MFRKSVIFLSLLLSWGSAVAVDWAPLAPAHLGSDYVGEENGQARLQIFQGKNVQYLHTPAERLPYLIQVKDGLLVDSHGELLDTSFSQTRSLSGSPVRTEAAIMVYGQDSKIYLSKNSSAGKFHHSSFLAGEPVWFAGEVTVENGKIISLTNNSGHYKPAVRHALKMMSDLDHAGVDTSTVKLHMGGYNYEQFFFGKPNAKELKEFTRYGFADFVKRSYGNPDLMPMMMRYENEIRANFIQDPKALVHMLNTLEQSMMPQQEALVAEALEKNRHLIFDDARRARNFSAYFSRPFVTTISPICKMPDFLKKLFK